MRTLDLHEMENVQGGKFRVSCAINAAGIGISIATGNVLMFGWALYNFISDGCHYD